MSCGVVKPALGLNLLEMSALIDPLNQAIALRLSHVGLVREWHDLHADLTLDLRGVVAHRLRVREVESLRRR